MEDPPPKILVVILSWPGQIAAAKIIESDMNKHGVPCFVIHSHTGISEDKLPMNWAEMGGDSYFGAKFLESLSLFSSSDADVLLQIHADVNTPSWIDVVSQCRQDFAEHPNLAIWGPNVSGGSWELHDTVKGRFRESTSPVVTLVEALVWGISRRLLERVETVPIHLSPLGYGIDLSVAALANSMGLEARIRKDLRVQHPPATGYDTAQASLQGKELFSHLALRDRLYIKRVLGTAKIRRLARLPLRDRALMVLPSLIRTAILGLRNSKSRPALSLKKRV